MGNIFAPSNITVLVGDSDAGKSLYARSLAVAISCGSEFCGFGQSSIRPVFIINAEQDAKKSQDYTKRSMAALNIEETPGNLYDCPLLSSPLPEGMPDFDILNKKWQSLLLETIPANSVLIIDNLLTTTTKSANSSTLPQGIRTAVKQLQEKGVSLILVHHTGNSGKALGSSALESLSQNFFTLHANEGPSDGGVNAKLTFVKIKSYPQLRGKVFTATLPYATPEEQGGPWKFVSEHENAYIQEKSTNAVTTEPEFSSPKPDIAGRPKIQQDALSIALKKGNVTKSDLTERDYKEGTVKEHLRELTKNGQLIQTGSGRGTFYTLPQATK